MGWAEGEIVVRREVRRGSPWMAVCVIVVADEPGLLATYLPGGAQFAFPTEEHALGPHPWLGRGAWEGHGVLMLQRPGEPDRSRWPTAAQGLAMATVSGGKVLRRPGLGEMAVPVAVYIGVITLMLWRACARVSSPAVPARAAWLGLAGAIAFGASDTLLAFDRFLQPIEGVHLPILVLYWAGQCGIAASAALAGPRDVPRA